MKKRVIVLNNVVMAGFIFKKMKFRQRLETKVLSKQISVRRTFQVKGIFKGKISRWKVPEVCEKY